MAVVNPVLVMQNGRSSSWRDDFAVHNEKALRQALIRAPHPRVVRFQQSVAASNPGNPSIIRVPLSVFDTTWGDVVYPNHLPQGFVLRTINGQPTIELAPGIRGHPMYFTISTTPTGEQVLVTHYT